MSRAIPFMQSKTGMSQVIPGYPANMCRDIPSYPILYRVILRRDIPGYPRISQDKILVLGYPITSFLFWVIPGYPGIYTKSGYPGISRDNPSCRFSRCDQPVVKPNRKCCVNGKVESGALKSFFLGSKSALLHSSGKTTTGDIPGYPGITRTGVYPGITRDNPKQKTCNGISQYKNLVLGYLGISWDIS